VGGGADCAGALAEDLGCGLGIESDDNAEQDCLGLVPRQGRDPIDRGTHSNGFHRAALGVIKAGQACKVFYIGGHAWTALSASEMIEGPVSCDRGCPATETASIGAVCVYVARDLQPGLRRDILGVIADQSPQVTQQSRLHRAVQRPERQLIAVSRFDRSVSEVARIVHGQRFPSRAHAGMRRRRKPH
jgi:hypothetical protein